MNLSMKQTHREQTYGCLGRGKVVMEGRIGSLGLADANFFFPPHPQHVQVPGPGMETVPQ